MVDFSLFRKALDDFSGQLSSVRRDLETVRREIEDIHYAPACMEDVLSALETWAKANEKKYGEYLRGVIGGLVSLPANLADTAKVWGHFHSREILPEPTHTAPISRDIQLCGLLGSARFIELMKPQLQSMDWSKAGLPMRDRAAAVEALEKKASVLQTKESALLKSAEKAGLNVS